MTIFQHDPQASWRNHQRVRFIKGLYYTWHDLNALSDAFVEEGKISHDAIDTLLETHLRQLKDLSHHLYRMPESWETEQKRQRILDRILGELWHELDKARDNARLLEAYHTEQANFTADDDKTLQALGKLNSQVLSAARKELPVLLRRAKRMMEKLMPLFEAIIHVYSDNPVVLRTLYFERDEFEKLMGKNALDHFFRLMYGSVGKGYVSLIESLVDTQHIIRANAALSELKTRAQSNSRLRPFAKEAEALISNP
ncbi:MAG: hypothetical protein P9L94_03690 [Candidatus Hinthialibacter antarcticus]|nr:hypothetical protein [Candidatus Hinthialibacter antarcticus]